MRTLIVKYLYRHLTLCLSISQKPLDDTTALDMLSSDFSAVPAVKPSAPDAKRFTPEPTPPTHKVPQTNLHKEQTAL